MRPIKEITYGRSLQNDVSFPNDSKASRFHCRITKYDNGTFEIMDTGSTNGTYVNGRIIPVRRPYPLQQTDIVRIGETTLPWMRHFSSYNTTMGTSGGTEVYPPYPPFSQDPDGGDDGNGNESGNISLAVFFCGLLSIGIVIYIVIEYYGNSLLGLGGAILGGTAGFLKMFPWYLHGVAGSGGQWLPMIAAFVVGGAADLIDNFNKNENGLSRIGLWLANIGVSVALLFLVLAILAPTINPFALKI